MKKIFKKATYRLLGFVTVILLMTLLIEDKKTISLVIVFTLATTVAAWSLYDLAQRGTRNFVLDLWRGSKSADHCAYEMKKYSNDPGTQELILFHVIQESKDNITFARCFITRARQLGLHEYADRVIQEARARAIENVEKQLVPLFPSGEHQRKKILHFFQNDLISALVVMGDDIKDESTAAAYDKVRAMLCYFFERGNKEFLDQFFKELETTRIIKFKGEEKEGLLLREMVKKVTRLFTLNGKMSELTTT